MILLVGGSAPCLFADLARAKEKFPESELMLVNGACVAVEDAQHVLAGHTNKAEQFARARRRAFPLALPWRLHATRFVRRPPPTNQYPSVTDWHPPDYSSGATSAGKAAMIGLFALNAEKVILCGCPMDGSGYFPGESIKGAEITHDRACQRVGDATKQDRTIIRRYRDTMAKLAQTTFRGRVFSMSGFTRDCLGEP